MVNPKQQHPLTSDATADDHVWLIPRRGGLDVVIGAADSTNVAGFIKYDREIEAWRIHRLDLIGKTYGTPEEAAHHLINALRAAGDL
jgi:hypothetical protein